MSITVRLAVLAGDLRRKVAAAETEIYALAGHEFNIASPKQLQQVLFTEQKLPALRRKNRALAPMPACWSELAAQHPLPAKIIEFRQYSKLKNTYVDALPELVNPHRAGACHVSTSRGGDGPFKFERSEPAKHSDPHARRARHTFRVFAWPRGWRLLSADYSQIELRVLAQVLAGRDAVCGIRPR